MAKFFGPRRLRSVLQLFKLQSTNFHKVANGRLEQYMPRNIDPLEARVIVAPENYWCAASCAAAESVSAHSQKGAS